MDSFDTLPGGLRLYREAGDFKLNTDASLLCSFLGSRAKSAKRICDLGAGAGVIALSLAHKNPSLNADCVEIQPDAAKLLAKNIAENGMTARVRAFCRDFRLCREYLEAGAYDLAVSNPPYFPSASSRSEDEGRATMRSELCCTVSELCGAAAWLLKNGGVFALVFRPERLSELFCAMTANGIEPKRLRLVSRDALSPPSLALVEGRKQGKPGLSIEPTIYLKGGEE